MKHVLSMYKVVLSQHTHTHVSHKYTHMCTIIYACTHAFTHTCTGYTWVHLHTHTYTKHTHSPDCMKPTFAVSYLPAHLFVCRDENGV